MVRRTDHPAMTIAVDLGCIATKLTKQKYIKGKKEAYLLPFVHEFFILLLVISENLIAIFPHGTLLGIVETTVFFH